MSIVLYDQVPEPELETQAFLSHFGRSVFIKTTITSLLTTTLSRICNAPMQVTIAWNLAIGDDISVMAMTALPCRNTGPWLLAEHLWVCLVS